MDDECLLYRPSTKEARPLPPKTNRENEITLDVVEAPMESHLNLAHTFSRRADMLTKSRKYDEAIMCHRKAAEFLLQAIETAPLDTPTCLLESMTLQHKAYLSEIKRLQCKSQLLDLMDRTDKATATISQATQTDGLHSLDLSHPAIDEDVAYEILRTNDDAMSKILSGIKEEKFSKVKNEPQKCDNAISALPSLEEVVQLNKRLSQAVSSLLQELVSTKAEKRQMEEKLCDSQESDRQGLEGELKFNSLDLPPLEVSYPELAMLKMDT